MFEKEAEEYTNKGWHFVKDKLPTEEKDFLVYSGEEWRLSVCRYFPRLKSWEAGADAIAWAEIPEPPKEVKNDDQD